MKNTYPVYDICTLSGFKQDDILISRFAPYLAVHKNLHRPHKHTFYHLVLFTKGGGKHTVDFETFSVNPWHMYFMIPGQVHSWAFEGEVDGYVINFSASFFNTLLLNPAYPEQFPFFDGLAENGVLDVPVHNRDNIRKIFELIVAETETAHLMASDMVRALLLQLFISVARLHHSTSQPAPAYNQKLLRTFQKLIDQNFIKLRLPRDYAGLLYITPNHLNALCQNVLGISAGDVIRNRVILEAKRLLVNPELSITEIAYQLNFADNSYFSKFFKKQSGISPEEFRKKSININL